MTIAIFGHEVLPRGLYTKIRERTVRLTVGVDSCRGSDDDAGGNAGSVCSIRADISE